jgi:hypothetical protein
MDAHLYPSYVTNAACTGAATKNPLTTWITGINGNTVTLHDAASQNTTSTMLYDAAIGIYRAALTVAYTTGVAPGTVYLPPGTTPGFYYYYINSFLSIPINVSIKQAGSLYVNETISLAGNQNWDASWGSYPTPQFGVDAGAASFIFSGNPGFYIAGTGVSFYKLNILGGDPNGGVDLVADSTPANFDYVNFQTASAGSGDYLGMAVILRSRQSQNDYHFNRVAFLTGPDQVNDKSWTPAFWVAPSQDNENVGIAVTFENTFWNRRGFAAGGGYNSSYSLGKLTSNWSYRQGGITPMFAFMQASPYQSYTLNDASQDTEGQPLAVALIITPNNELLGPHIIAQNPTGGAGGPLFSGRRPSFSQIDMAGFSSAKSLPNRDFSFHSGGAVRMAIPPFNTAGGATSACGP